MCSAMGGSQPPGVGPEMPYRAWGHLSGKNVQQLGDSRQRVDVLGAPPLLRAEGLGFLSLLSISVYRVSSVDQPLPSPELYKSAGLLPALQEDIDKNRGQDWEQLNYSPCQSPTKRPW